jgi:hypothetical protein
VAAVAAKLLVPEMLQLVPVWGTGAGAGGTDADLVLLKPKPWMLLLGVTDEFMSKANLLLGFEIACCWEVRVYPAEVPKLVDVAFPANNVQFGDQRNDLRFSKYRLFVGTHEY